MLNFLIDIVYNAICSYTTIAIVTLFVSVWLYYSIKDHGVPPGPYGIPYLGYWPFLKDDTCHEQLLDMKKKYGDIFSFRTTGQLFINLAGLKTLREAHVTKGDCFAERPMDDHILRYLLKDGVPFTNGEYWQTMRKFFLQQFKERGMTASKDNTAEALYEAIATCTQQLAGQAGKPVNIVRLLQKGTHFLIRHTLLGPNTPISENELESLLENYRFVNTIVSPTRLILYGKLSRFLIFPFLPNFKKAMEIQKSTKNKIKDWVEDHRRSYNEDNIRDVIDSFIKEKNLRRSKGDPTHEYFTDEALAANLLQFMGDGIINLSTFITAFLKSLMDHPEEQEKIFEELTEVCGKDRDPTVADKSKLTYTNAFVLEALRINSFTLVFPNLICTRETSINGYRIPRGAITLPNSYSIHCDPQTYEDPHLFNPSRFLAINGKKKAESPVTFGIGKRICLVEGFVMMIALLFCATIVKHFRISYPQSKTFYEIFKTRELEINVEPRKS